MKLLPESSSPTSKSADSSCAAKPGKRFRELTGFGPPRSLACATQRVHENDACEEAHYSSGIALLGTNSEMAPNLRFLSKSQSRRGGGNDLCNPLNVGSKET